jgi:hypothetical protein
MKLPQWYQVTSDDTASTSSLAKPQCCVSMIKLAEMAPESFRNGSNFASQKMTREGRKAERQDGRRT